MTQITPLTDDEDEIILVKMTHSEYVAYTAAKKAKTRHTMKGLAGIRQLFHCSQAQAFKIAHADWFQPAVVRMGRLLVFDADRAWDLAQKAQADVIKPAA